MLGRQRSHAPDMMVPRLRVHLLRFHVENAGTVDILTAQKKILMKIPVLEYFLEL